MTKNRIGSSSVTGLLAALAATVLMSGPAYSASTLTGGFTVAAEGIASSTVVGDTTIGTPQLKTTMGVPLVSFGGGTHYTFILQLPAGATLAVATGAKPTLTYAGGGSVVISPKVIGTNRYSWDLFVTASTSPLDSFTLSNIAVNGHGLQNPGTFVVTVNIMDQGETAQIDNPTPVPFPLYTSVDVVNVYASAIVPNSPGTVKKTTTNVTDPAGPLFGFVVPGAQTPADAQYKAFSNYVLVNNVIGALLPNLSGFYDFTVAGGSVALTVTDTSNFGGLAPGGFCLGVNCFTVTAGVATLTLPASAFSLEPSAVNTNNTFLATGTTSLGTSRTFGLSGTVTPAGAALTHPLVNTNGINGGYWTWGANATVLQSPWFSTFNSGGTFQNRFVFLNSGAAPITYTSICFAETGNTATLGTKAAGTLIAAGTTVINATDVCTFSGNTRGSVQFVISGPAGSLSGDFQQVNPQQTVTSVVLDRVYAGPTY